LGLLAWGMLRRVANPYGHFAFGGLLALGGIVWHTVDTDTSWLYFLALAIAFVIALIWPRRTVVIASHHP